MSLNQVIEMPSDFRIMVEDRWRDFNCGALAGCSTIFIDRDYDENLHTLPHHVYGDVLSAAR